MISLYDSLLLASTKLKTRKIRLIVTVVVSSLIFASLSFLALVADGTIHSLKDFGREGYGGRYFVQANPITTEFSPDDAAVIARLTAVQKDLVARKKAEAKRLGLEYTEANDQSLPLTEQQTGPNSKSLLVNFGSTIVQDEINRVQNATPGITYQDFITRARSAQATATYRSTTSGGMYFSSSSGSGKSISVILNGKEKQPSSNSKELPAEPKGIDTIATTGWRSADKALIQPFVLHGQNLDASNKTIPIIAPFSAAEEVLGLKPLPQTATSAERLERLKAVRTTIAGRVATLCYRNSASQDLFEQAVTQANEIAANKDKKDYTKPSLVYQAPQTACGPTTILSDKRTAEEKKSADNQKIFDRQFNGLVDPEQGTVQVRIVGLSPDVNFGPSISASTILSGLFSSSLGAGWVSPIDAVATDAFATKFIGDVATLPAIAQVYYAEFPNLKAMESFIKSQTCDNVTSVSTPIGSTVAGSGPGSMNNCVKAGKVFGVGSYGNSAGAIEQFRSGIWQVLRYVILAILIIASLIMMGNVGKIIADSRRETAVFRALGAKRIDISQIYITYVILIGLLVALSSFIVGAVGAFILNNKFSPELSVTAVLTYNAADVTKQFTLFGVNPLHLLAIAGLAIAAGLLSAILPLLTNMRRNPIRDMRDEN